MPKSLFPAASSETRQRLEQVETLRLLNSFDWASTSLGPIADWSETLRGAVRMMLGSGTPMVLLVGDRGILIYNDAYAEFAGDRHPGVFGLPAEEAWPEIADFNREHIDRGLAGESLILRDQELVLDRHGQPEPVWMDLHYSPIFDLDGRSLGTLCIVHEITTRVMAEKALARSEERLSLALSGSNLVGTWDWDVVNNVVTADDRFAQLYNLDPLRAGLGVPVEDFIRAIDPADVERVSGEIARALGDGSNYRSEYRVVGTDGTVRWVVTSGRPRLNAEGKPIRFPGVAVDITEQKHISEALAESEMRFRTLADAMPQMVWSTLPDGYHDYYNARWYEFTGVPPGSTDGEGWNNIFHPDDQARAWEVWRHSLATGDTYEIEYRLRHHSGDYRWTLGRALPIRDTQGNIMRWIGTCTDIHETKLTAEERELVAQELSHRIKNIFAVLTGLIGLSARSRPDIKPFADELRSRIYALGEAHDFVRPHTTVSRPPENQGSLQALVRRLLQPYVEGQPDRLQFVGDDAPIDDAAATPLALLFHELATNAAKYGAFAVDEGRVLVSGQIRGESYHLSWKELGGLPLPAEMGADGFGSRVTSLSVEGQLRGKLQRFWEQDGLRVEVEVPLDTLRRTSGLRQRR